MAVVDCNYSDIAADRAVVDCNYSDTAADTVADRNHSDIAADRAVDYNRSDMAADTVADRNYFDKAVHTDRTVAAVRNPNRTHHYHRYHNIPHHRELQIYKSDRSS